MANVSIPHSIVEINSEKAFATKITTSGSSQSIDLSTIQMPLSPAGEKVCDPSGANQPFLTIQCDADFYYCFGKSGDAVTLPAGANPGIFVAANFQEQVRPASGPGRTFLYVIQSTAAGTLRVHVTRTSVRL